MKPEGLKHAFKGMTIVILNEFGIIADTNHHAYDPTTKTKDSRIFGNTVDSANFGSQGGRCSIFEDIFSTLSGTIAVSLVRKLSFPEQ